jgi:hypothetical protein
MTFTAKNVEKYVRSGAISLLSSENHANGFISEGDSNLAEANLVMHIASSLIQDSHFTCAESPFRLPPSKKILHLDMYIQFETGNISINKIAILECKRMAPNEKSKKLTELLKDFDRLRGWCTSGALDRPLPLVAIRPAPKIFGILAAIITDEPAFSIENGKHVASSEITFSKWWCKQKLKLKNYPKKKINLLADVLNKAVKKGSILSHYSHDNYKTSVVYAVFDLGKLKLLN